MLTDPSKIGSKKKTVFEGYLGYSNFFVFKYFFIKISVPSELVLKRTNPGSFVFGWGFTGVSNQYSYDRNIMSHFFDENISFTSRLVWYPREPPPGYKRPRIRAFQN